MDTIKQVEPTERYSLFSPPAGLCTLEASTDLFHLRVLAQPHEAMSELLSPEALLFIEELEDRFGDRRKALLNARTERALAARSLEFLENTTGIRASAWKIAPPPAELSDRRTELTRSALDLDYAMRSSAQVVVADLEDGMSPTWENVIQAQTALRNLASERTADQPLLFVQPRAWHSIEKQVHFDGEPISASLFDFGLFCFHSAKVLRANKSGTHFYLPKIENHLEARLWSDVFAFTEKRLQLHADTIRCSVMIETVPAIFEMDEILFELKAYACGLSLGRAGYQIGLLKVRGEIVSDETDLKNQNWSLDAVSKFLIATCHRRGAHAIADATSARLDFAHEAKLGFDGARISDLDDIKIASELFIAQMAPQPNQVHLSFAEGFAVTPAALMPMPTTPYRVTEQGVSESISTALNYLSSWLRGQGSILKNGIQTNAMAAEAARSQLWQWVKNEINLVEGTRLTRNEFRRRLESERARFAGQAERGRLHLACELLEKLVLVDAIHSSMTESGYAVLER